jgi:hypothetical protein
VFYILAAEKERLTTLKQWCQLNWVRSSQATMVISMVELEGAPASRDDPGDRDQAGAAAGQSSGERQDPDGSTSRAGAGHRDQVVEPDPSLLPNYIPN